MENGHLKYCIYRETRTQVEMDDDGEIGHRTTSIEIVPFSDRDEYNECLVSEYENQDCNYRFNHIMLWVVSGYELIQLKESIEKLERSETKMEKTINQVMLELLETIKTLELELIDLTDKKEELLLKNKLIETGLLDKVMSEVLPGTTTPRFSSDVKRKAEAKKRLAADSEYKINAENLKAVERKFRVQTVEVSYLKRKFRSYEAVTSWRH